MPLVTWEGKGSSSAVALYERNANPSYSPVFSLRGHKASINYVSLYSPPLELRRSPPQHNSVGRFGDAENDTVDGIFASSLATSCDAGGEVWVWDLDLRRALFSFKPIEAAQHIKQRRIAKEVNAHVDRLEREKGTPLSPQELASAIASKMSELEDDDLRPSSSAAMSGVLSASILVVRSEVRFESTSRGEEGREYDDDEGNNLMALPILVTQCRNQKVYFWLVRELDPCEEESTVNDINGDSDLTQTESGPRARKGERDGEFMVSPLIAVRLIHEVKVPQLGFCPSLQWVCEKVSKDSKKKRGAEKDRGLSSDNKSEKKSTSSPPTTLDELYAKAVQEKEDNSSENDDLDNEDGDDDAEDYGDYKAASSPQPQSVCVASPCDNNGTYSFQRFSISIVIQEEEEETVEVRVESNSLLTIADFKCGQAMTATLFTDMVAKKAKKGQVRKQYLTIGYESGHVVVVDVTLATSGVFRTLASPRVFPDPITACCGVRRVPEGLIVLVGSAEGMLRSVSIPLGFNATKTNTKTTESSPFGRSLMAVTGGHQGWSHRAQHGLGSVAVDCVKNSPRNSLVLVAGWDGQVRLLRAHSGEVVTNLVHHKGSVSCVAVAPDEDEVSLLVGGGSGCGESNGACPRKRFAFSLSSNLQSLAGVKAAHTYAFATAGIDQEIAVWAIHSYF